jgi:hypothetical protein
MNQKAVEKLLNPLPGGKIAAAREFGVDLNSLAENLRLEPQERIEKLQRAMRFIDEVRKQGELTRQNKKKNG